MHAPLKPQDCGDVKAPISDAAFRQMFREVVYGAAPAHRQLDEIGKLLLLCLIDANDGETPAEETIRRLHILMGGAPNAH